MGFPRQVSWSGLPFPPPGHLPDPGIEPVTLESPALADRFFFFFLPLKPLGKPSSVDGENEVIREMQNKTTLNIWFPYLPHFHRLEEEN